MDARPRRNITRILAVAALAGGCLYVLLPFLPAILFAAAAVISSWPLYARLRGAIDRHTAHAKAVSGNIMDYYSREAVRQSQLPQAALPSNATQHRGLSEQDRNRLATNLESPHEPGRDYNIGIEAIPATNLEQLPSQDLRLLGQAVRDFASYQDHAGVKGQRLREEHKRAQEREAA